MTLKERNDVLRLALDNINYIVTENAGNNPTDIEKQYDCNAFAFDAICKVVANCVRAGLPGNDLPPKTFFTPEAAKKFGQKLKMPVISMPGRAAIKYHVDNPELPRLSAHIESIKYDDGKTAQECTVYIGNEVLSDMYVFRGKTCAKKMVRQAMKGAMSHIGKHRRMTANRQAREAAKKEGK